MQDYGRSMAENATQYIVPIRMRRISWNVLSKPFSALFRKP